ncbi:MAG: hypothetical protein HUU50_01665 [Candidatus Brocadiae bacterium]|nr:hypothetical protein [Candidatus Brocadiia bacterium]
MSTKKKIFPKFFCFFLFFSLGIGLFCLLLSCKSHIVREKLSFPPNPPKAVHLYLTADVEGSLEPCGCKSGQIGGLPRQAQYLLKSRQSPYLVVDAGNSMSVTPTRYEFFKWYYILQIYEKIGYDALNLGQNEVALSSSQIAQVTEKMPIPLISANVLEKDTSELLVRPYVIKEVDGVKIAIIGLVNPKAKTGEGIVLADPGTAFAKYLPEMLENSHLIFVLSALSIEQIAFLCKNFPQIGMILNTGETGTHLPENKESVVVSSLTAKSRYIQQIRFAFEPSGDLAWVNGGNVPLDESIQDHSGTVYLLNRYREELGKERFYLEQLGNSKEKYVGASRCSMCHAEIYRSWKQTAHSRSLDSLKKKNNHHDPHCLKCHVTGFGIKNGYEGEEKTPDFAFIGCEVCHGPSSLHTFHNNPDQLRPSTSHPNPKKICLECHTWEHCGNFDFDTFWARIAHPKK